MFSFPRTVLSLKQSTEPTQVHDHVIWDVVNVSNDFGLQSTAELLEPLDYSLSTKSLS
jgi:hypothetical protein